MSGLVHIGPVEGLGSTPVSPGLSLIKASSSADKKESSKARAKLKKIGSLNVGSVFMVLFSEKGHFEDSGIRSSESNFNPYDG